MIDTILLLATVFAGIAAIGYFVDVSFKTLGNKLPRAYSIAVICFQKSGKTTLITTLFCELFANRALNISTIPRGL